MKDGKSSAQWNMGDNTDEKCNRFTCEWCRGAGMLGCQNAHPYGFYAARMNDLRKKGRDTSRSVGCMALESPKNSGNYVICPKDQKKDCIGFRKELCSGTSKAACNCQNPFCSDPDLVTVESYTDYGMTPPKNWKPLKELWADEVAQYGAEVTCKGFVGGAKYGEGQLRY